jgi:hypothetical protein
MWKYARALDTGNAEAYAALYTVDGQFGSGANARRGVDALAKMITGTGRQGGAQPATPRPQLYHTSRTTSWCSSTRTMRDSTRTTSRWRQDRGRETRAPRVARRRSGLAQQSRRRCRARAYGSSG